MRTLAQLTVKNFKSIRDQTLRLGNLNVFVGSNGSGKSNLIGIFRFLNRVVSGELQTLLQSIGLEQIRRVCPHFNQWLGILGSRGSKATP